MHIVELLQGRFVICRHLILFLLHLYQLLISHPIPIIEGTNTIIEGRLGATEPAGPAIHSCYYRTIGLISFCQHVDVGFHPSPTSTGSHPPCLFPVLIPFFPFAQML
nr:hypothetical protein Q903MT_gene4655 [Picea sitchensis]